MSAAHDILPQSMIDEDYAEHFEEAETTMHAYQEWRLSALTLLGWKGDFENTAVPEDLECEFKDGYEAGWTPLQMARYAVRLVLTGEQPA